MDGTAGYVYVQTNDANANEIVVYRRNAAGRLERCGSYLTGGCGSGEPHLPSQSSVVAAAGRVFVANAGSDDVTLFAVDGDELEALDRVSSGGSTPRSVAVHEQHLYVLNTAGGRDLRGLRLVGDELVPIDGGSIAFGEDTDPAQVAFSPDGRSLLVTDRAANAIHVVRLDESGRVLEAATQPSSGATPYGFDVRADGTVVVTEAAGAQAGKASASSYRLDGGKLQPLSGAVGNGRSEVCWAVITKNGRTAFVTNFADGTISSYAIGDDGRIELRNAVAASTVDGAPGIRDEALSSDGGFLYALHADTGNVYAWKVSDDGQLEPLGSANGLPLTAAGLAAS
jgi:6-phosphogluconolactonase (cycloisomerase 2 family)